MASPLGPIHLLGGTPTILNCVCCTNNTNICRCAGGTLLAAACCRVHACVYVLLLGVCVAAGACLLLHRRAAAAPTAAAHGDTTALTTLPPILVLLLLLLHMTGRTAIYCRSCRPQQPIRRPHSPLLAHSTSGNAIAPQPLPQATTAEATCTC